MLNQCRASLGGRGVLEVKIVECRIYLLSYRILFGEDMYCLSLRKSVIHPNVLMRIQSSDIVYM